MTKYLTRIETSIGVETYILLVESENALYTSSGAYHIDNAQITKIYVRYSNDSEKHGPFKLDYYKKLRFPIENTLVSEQSFEYGPETTKE